MARASKSTKRYSAAPAAARVKTNRAGRELLEAVREVHRAVTTGNYADITIRDVEIPAPGEWGPGEVRALRDRLGVSQRVFGELVGLSTVQVAHWEIGHRAVGRLAARLLDTINEDPQRFMGKLIVRKAG